MAEEFFSIIVTKAQSKERLDNILATMVSRRKARKLLDNGAVFVDGKRVKVASRKVNPGSKIKAPYDIPKLPPPIDWERTILYQDEHMVVVNKPARWPSAPTPYGDKGSLSHALSKHLGCDVMVVQRLDVHTTGTLLYARSPEGAKRITKAFMEKQIEKVYVAITRKGPIEPGLIDLPLAPTPGNSARFCVDPNGRRAVTEVLKVIPLGAEFQMLLLKLHTGRTHQIRVHLAHLGLPVAGDLWYEGPEYNRLFLHAHSIKILSKELGEHHFVAPLPDYWAEIFEAVGSESIKILD